MGTDFANQDAAGQVLDGKYVLQSRLGGGAMGTVYRARQQTLNRVVAVKLLKAGSDASPEDRVRFVREARLLTRLRHPNLVAVYDADVSSEQPYIVMELVEGPSLVDVLHEPARHPRLEAERVALGLAAGLEYIHSEGVLHRDIKPANVLLRSPREALLADFGLAREGSSQALTTEGFVVGTPAYLAPEQLEGGGYSVRSDLFQLGLVLYEVALRRPYVAGLGNDLRTLLVAKLEGKIPELRAAGADCSAEFSRAVMKCLERDPARRPASAVELVAELRRLPGMASQEVDARDLGTIARAARRPAGGSATRRAAATGRDRVAAAPASGAHRTAVSNSGWKAGWAVAASLLAVVGLAIWGTAGRRTADRPPGSVGAVGRPVVGVPAAPAAVEIAVKEAVYVYDSARGRLRVRWKLTGPVTAGYSLDGGPETVLSRAPDGASGAVELAYRPGGKFRLAIHRSDGGGPLALTQADLLGQVRGQGKALAGVLEKFWSVPGRTDQRFVEELVSRLGPVARLASNREAQLQRLRQLLRGWGVLEPVRRFLEVSPLFFDSREVPPQERLALYRVLSPLELADSVADVYKLGSPFGEELSSRTGETWRQQKEPAGGGYDNFFATRGGRKTVMNTRWLLPGPQPTRRCDLILGAVFEFETAAVLKVSIGDTPVYFSNRPARCFVSDYRIPYVKRTTDGSIMESSIVGDSPFVFKDMKFAIVGRHLDPDLSRDLSESFLASAIYIRRPSMLENNHVWGVWLGFGRR